MLYLIGEWLHRFYGPLRLLTSHLVLGGLSVVLCFLVTFKLLPRLMNRLPRDRGRAHAVQAAVAQGKPTGAGLIFVTIFTAIELLTLPPSFQGIAILALNYLAMLSGWLDDRSIASWGEYKKGLIDLFIAAAACAVLCEFKTTSILGGMSHVALI